MKHLFLKLNIARSMPPKLLFETLISIAKHKVRKYYIKLFPVKLSYKDFLNASIYETEEEFINRNIPVFFFTRDIDKIVNMVEKKYPKSIGQNISAANEILRHNFDLLGSGKAELGEEINWHVDFKSGFEWDPKVYYLGTRRHITLGDDSDVKLPWELSRCQHFVILGKAYWYIGDEKYAEEFIKQVESWIEKNPLELGVNWTCTMDVAIRAVNWIWGCYFFSKSKSLTDEFKINFLKNLFLHGRHIINNLEFGQIRGNHYLSDIAGLVYLGIFFQETKEGKKWLEKGISALMEEMAYQVYPDGVDFEGSISYHRLVTELFLSATLLCLKKGITFPEWYTNRLEKMIEFALYYTKPGGNAPQIGDNDDGRLHILANYGNWNRMDHRYLLSIGAALFNREDFKSAAGGFHEDAFWLLGEKGLEDSKKIPGRNFSLGSRAFTDGGFYIMRHSDLFMIVDCIPVNSKAPSGHKHNSRLSFELFAFDKSFIIDPGAYIYTADKNMRNLFRSTRYHNTVVVDEQEQNRFKENELFRMPQDASVKVNKWEITDKYDFLDAQHNGYARLKNPVIHRRQIYFNKGKSYWVVRDLLTGEGAHKFELYFHFAPMRIKQRKDFIIQSKNETGSNVMILPLDTEGLSIAIENGWVSYSYGKKIQAPIVKYSKTGSMPMRFTNILYPYKEYIDMNTEDIIEMVKTDISLKGGII